MTQGIYEFDICLKFNGTANIKAPSKKKALEVLKNLRASLHEVKAYDDRIINYSVTILANAEEQV